MNTHNIISTPEITGNIGSCTSQLQKVYSYSGIITSEGQNIVTNSCTGTVTTSNFNEVSFINITLSFALAFLLVIAILGWVFGRD